MIFYDLLRPTIISHVTYYVYVFKHVLLCMGFLVGSIRQLRLIIVQYRRKRNFYKTPQIRHKARAINQKNVKERFIFF